MFQSSLSAVWAFASPALSTVPLAAPITAWPPAYTVAVLAAIAGAIHVLLPDHWFPASVVAWQRGWGTGESAAVASGLLSLHVLLGASTYFVLGHLLSHLSPQNAAYCGWALFVVCIAVRGFRFGLIGTALRRGPSRFWQWLMVLALLGPGEFLIPWLIKSRQLGIGYLVPTAAFLSGTLLLGTVLIVTSRSWWNRPAHLPRWLQLTRTHSFMVPAAAAAVLGLGFLVGLA